MNLSLKDVDWEEDILKIQYKVNEIDDKLSQMEKSCCESETRLRQTIEFETAMKQLATYSEKIEDLDNSFKSHEKVLHILIGILIALEFFGVGEKLKMLLH